MGEARADKSNRLAQMTCPTPFPPREGTKVASAGEPEEHAAVCGHLHPSDPHLCLLDHVSLRFLQSQHRLPLSKLVTAKQAFKPQEDLQTRHFFPNQTLEKGFLLTQLFLPPGAVWGLGLQDFVRAPPLAQGKSNKELPGYS